ncbi:MAG: hypothetical protein DME92_04310 [Verrucomicrobia bacterium]|nr:MAG: hypothetical protein DME92_04310 [Verrucomicrobiota bacterium]
MIRLDRTSAEPLHQQLYRQIRDELRSGIFSDSASRLPSSRALAADLGVARLTVNLAFSKLHAEGYLQTKAHVGRRLILRRNVEFTFLIGCGDFRISVLERSSISERPWPDQASR